MKLTTRGRYAVTAMLDLALNGEHGPISLAAISQRQSISLSYLEQLFAKLRKNDLVASVRGPGGGYRLSRCREQINVADIIAAVNESTDSTGCKGKGDCQNGEPCLTHQLWDDLSQQIHTFLSGISLGSLTERREVKTVCERQTQQSDEGGVNDESINVESLINAKAIDL
ncbi:MAG: Fe-S cluster assembly transcription factor [Gammaproteobacteria bacterium]|nr:Fe-S cluster assembly transcription factor [Gammaproteobacteria bacterium]MBQ0840499.1 Fe-S cluster assembly transcription factor [Gammaproteobacteria bacterium]